MKTGNKFGFYEIVILNVLKKESMSFLFDSFLTCSFWQGKLKHTVWNFALYHFNLMSSTCRGEQNCAFLSWLKDMKKYFIR